MKTKKLSLILTVLILLDFATTYYVTPTLEHEANILHQFFNVGWWGLIINAILRIIIVTYLSYLFDKAREQKEEIANAKLSKSVIYMLGYVFIRMWIWSTVLVCINNLMMGIYANEHFMGTLAYDISFEYVNFTSNIIFEVQVFGKTVSWVFFFYVQKLICLIFCIKYLSVFLKEYDKKYTTFIIVFIIMLLN
ncbi:MAG: hypothetical protein DDT42_01953 [candidate division WS2 bacterium]|uniref:Uncharacterized protein n=1 Tax=Psychracetigena formicireducens TaxID=2986056 RepID=A0A9E2BIU9_PSYF1|nr:hypothetical protein [Candidatus Psychracetigena formicireducens]